MKAVQFDDYGDIAVLDLRDVARPEPGPDQVLVAVRAAAINPSEAAIRTGRVRDIFPATFPSGQGSDLAGVVEEIGTGVSDISVGDEVIGFTDNRASQAEYVLCRGGQPDTEACEGTNCVTPVSLDTGGRAGGLGVRGEGRPLTSVAVGVVVS